MPRKVAVEKEKVVAADDNQTVCYLDSFLEREAPRSKPPPREPRPHRGSCSLSLSHGQE